MKSACKILLQLSVLAIFIGACRDRKDEPDAAERPRLTADMVTVPLHGSADVYVDNCMKVWVEKTLPFVDVSVSGCTLSLKGTDYGSGELLVRADGHRLSLAVVVAGISEEPVPDEPMESDDYAAQLADSSVRFSTGDLYLDYDSPGTMFGCSPDGRYLKIASLVTGTVVELTFEDDVFDSSGMNVPVDVGAVLAINGKTVGLRYAKILRCENRKIWMLCMTDGGQPVWLVMCEIA